jgi:hypothetical protein
LYENGREITTDLARAVGLYQKGCDGAAVAIPEVGGLHHRNGARPEHPSAAGLTTYERRAPTAAVSLQRQHTGRPQHGNWRRRGRLLQEKDYADLVEYARTHFMTIIPDMPSISMRRSLVPRSEL